jgi:MbtH protein
MANPFEDENGPYLVLVNHEGQHSLWPSRITVPAGWAIAHEEDTRSRCLEYINENWTDMRPKRLIDSMKQQEATIRPKPPETIVEDPRKEAS